MMKIHQLQVTGIETEKQVEIRQSALVIDLAAHIAAKAEAEKASLLAAQAAHDAEIARRVRLENFLTDLLAELEAA